MAWINAFALGTCTVTLTLNTVQMWSGPLAKGQSQSVVWTGMGNAQVVLAVDASGIVSVTVDDALWTPANSGYFEVKVAPPTPPAGPVRLTSVAGPGGLPIVAGQNVTDCGIAIADFSPGFTGGVVLTPPPDVPSVVDLSGLTATPNYYDFVLEFGSLG